MTTLCVLQKYLSWLFLKQSQCGTSFQSALSARSLTHLFVNAAAAKKAVRFLKEALQERKYAATPFLHNAYHTLVNLNLFHF